MPAQFIDVGKRTLKHQDQRRQSCSTMTNIQCQGNDLPDQWPPAYVADAETCAERCMQKAGCIAYTFNKGEDGTQGQVESGNLVQCWMKSSCSNPSEDRKATSGSCPKDSQVCVTWGDPHYITFSGGTFDFQKAGTYELVASGANNIALQGFNCPITGYSAVSFLVAVALKIGTHTVTIIGSTLKVDGNERNQVGSVTFDGTTVTKYATGGISVFLPSGAEVHTHEHELEGSTVATGAAINAITVLPKATVAASTGLCQNYEDSDSICGDANIFSITDLAYLDGKCGTTCSGTPSPTLPNEDPCTARGIAKEDAAAACAHLADVYFRSACVLDYCSTGGDNNTIDIAEETEEEVENYPTRAPTKTPTKTPTLTPTESPTKTPTESPTETPTASPSKTPTESPTQTPTKSLSPASASGDPHFTNMDGERFDVYGMQDVWLAEAESRN